MANTTSTVDCGDKKLSNKSKKLPLSTKRKIIIHRIESLYQNIIKVYFETKKRQYNLVPGFTYYYHLLNDKYIYFTYWKNGDISVDFPFNSPKWCIYYLVFNKDDKFVALTISINPYIPDYFTKNINHLSYAELLYFYNLIKKLVILLV
jgi:hypothetical protein